MEWEINWVFQDVWATNLSWVEVMVGSNGTVNMMRCVFEHLLKGKTNSWFLNLTTFRSMLKSLNARLQHLIALWGCITCLCLITTCKKWTTILQQGKRLNCKHGCYGGCGSLCCLF